MVSYVYDGTIPQLILDLVVVNYLYMSLSSLDYVWIIVTLPIQWTPLIGLCEKKSWIKIYLSMCLWGSFKLRTLYSPILTNKLLGAISWNKIKLVQAKMLCFMFLFEIASFSQFLTLTQCAAVMIHLLVIRAAPHLCLNWPLLYWRRDTCQGHSA